MNHLGAAILATGLWVAFGHMIAAAIGCTRFRLAIPSVMVVGLLLYVVSVALHYALLAVEQSRESEIQARDAELRALKAQINPHFLFNSLNSITALTTVDPARAREMCIRLSDFLRNTLGLGERESISWREELALSRAYLEVEQVRFGSRLQVEIDVDEACSDCMVPPLVLQPLIENAVKHGIATMVDGGLIRVEGHVRERLHGSKRGERFRSRFAVAAPSRTGFAQRSQPAGNALRRCRAIDRARREQSVSGGDGGPCYNRAEK